MTSTTLLLFTLLIAGALCAPQSIGMTTMKSPLNMSVDELNYIIQVRSGQSQPKPKVLSPCARAILGCCKGKTMNPNCSETLNCGALFFDDNPCEDRYMEAALKAARSFYEQLNNVST